MDRFIEALKYLDSLGVKEHDLYAEYDVLMVEGDFTDDQKSHLEGLGWYWSSDYDCMAKFM